MPRGLVLGGIHMVLLTYETLKKLFLWASVFPKAKWGWVEQWVLLPLYEHWSPHQPAWTLVQSMTNSVVCEMHFYRKLF